MGIASCHHRRAFGDAQVRLPQLKAVLAGQPIEPLDRCMDQLGVGREGDGLGLNGGVHRHPLEIARPQRTSRVRDPQALGQQKLELVAEALPPVALTLPRPLIQLNSESGGCHLAQSEQRANARSHR